jgi:tripartite-type tricarboxylate transporter receptor subunit TctC
VEEIFMMLLKRAARGAVLAMVGLMLPLAGFSQSYPARPITIVIPYPPGGSSDITVRLVAAKLQASLGQTVVADNRGGASGNIGSAYVARAKPDGYTLLLGTSATHGANVALFNDMGFDPIKDFAPVSLAARTVLAFTVNPSVPARNMQEFIQYAKSQPGKLSYASSGIGSPHHLAGELLNKVAGINLVHAPYRGGGPAVNDLIAGHIPVGIMTLSTVIQQHQAGKLRILALTEPNRFAGTPDIPTVGESVPGYEMTAFHVFLAPAGTPKAIVDLLSREIRNALKSKDVKDQLEQTGFNVAGMTPEETMAFLVKDIRTRTELVRAAGIKPE